MKSYNAIITMNGKQYRVSTHNGLGGCCRCITTDRLITSDATWKKILKVWAEEAHAEALEMNEALIVSASSEDVQTTEALTTEEVTMNTAIENVILNMTPEAKDEFVRDFPKYFDATTRYIFEQRDDLEKWQDEQIPALVSCIALATYSGTVAAGVACANVASALTGTSFEQALDAIELIAMDEDLVTQA